MTELLQSIKPWPILTQVTVKGEQYINIRHMISDRLQHQFTANPIKLFATIYLLQEQFIPKHAIMKYA